MPTSRMPFRLGTNRIGRLVVGSSFDDDYKAILDYATTEGYTLPSAGQQTLQNRLILDLKTEGIWSDLELFYVFATDGDRDFAKINWADPGTYDATEISTPTFTADEGFTGNGSSTALDSGFVPSTDAVASLTDSGMGGWMDLDGNSGTVIGSFATSRTHLIHKFTDGNTYYGIGVDPSTSPSAVPTPSQTDGLWVTYNDGGTVYLDINETNAHNRDDGANPAYSTVSLTMLTRKRSNTPTYDGWSSSTIKMGFFGSANAAQNIYTPFNTYLTSL